MITGGENVYQLETEQWLESHEHVEEAAGVGFSLEKWGSLRQLLSIEKRDIIKEKLVDFCSQKLAGGKVPKQFIFLEGLPKTHVGIVDKSS